MDAVKIEEVNERMIELLGARDASEILGLARFRHIHPDTFLRGLERGWGGEQIDAAGGRVVGKVWLQKLVYLLDQFGVPTGFSFTYRHYGPFFKEIAEVVEDDVVFGRIFAEQKRRSDGVPFVIYTAARHDIDEHSSSLMDSPGVKAALAAMQRHSATVLELAATIHWLAFVERVENWRAELVRRKGIKTKQGRREEALALLEELGLVPA